jgi:hypothetical protein
MSTGTAGGLSGRNPRGRPSGRRGRRIRSAERSRKDIAANGGRYEASSMVGYRTDPGLIRTASFSRTRADAWRGVCHTTLIVAEVHS